MGKPTRSICSFCSKQPKKLLRCTNCLTVRYCGADCQKNHWPEHKSACKRQEPVRPEKAEPKELAAARAFAAARDRSGEEKPIQTRNIIFRRQGKYQNFHVWMGFCEGTTYSMSLTTSAADLHNYLSNEGKIERKEGICVLYPSDKGLLSYVTSKESKEKQPISSEIHRHCLDTMKKQEALTMVSIRYETNEEGKTEKIWSTHILPSFLSPDKELSEALRNIKPEGMQITRSIAVSMGGES